MSGIEVKWDEEGSGLMVELEQSPRLLALWETVGSLLQLSGSVFLSARVGSQQRWQADSTSPASSG